MKSKLTFLLFISLTFHPYAQETETYKSFLHSGVVKWLYFMPADACGMDEISAYGDTIINQLEYKKLWDSYNFLFSSPVADIDQRWLVNGELTRELDVYIRQSNDSSKLYMFNAWNNNEYLVADMSLNVGDEFYFPGIGTEIVESVLYENGLKTIHFKSSTGLWNLVFVEGIGPNIAFHDIDRRTNLFPYSLICYSRSSFLFVKDPFVCGCVINKIPEVNNGQLSYRLINKKIEIQLNELFSGSWEMLDFSGKVVRRSELTNELVLRISITGLNRGVYLIRLYESGKESSVTLKVLL